MSLRIYKLYGERETNALNTHFGKKMAMWATVWAPDRTAASVSCTPAAESGLAQQVAGSAWVRYGIAPDDWMVMRVSRENLRLLPSVLCGDTDLVKGAALSNVGDSALAQEMAADAIDELASALLTGAMKPLQKRTNDVANPHSDTWTRGSGAIVLNALIGPLKYDFVCSASCARAALPNKVQRGTASTLTERHQSIASRKVALKAVAGWVQLDVRTLSDLAVGNVIKLDTRLDDPMSLVVSVEGEPTVCAARLGARQGSKAIRLSNVNKEGR